MMKQKAQHEALVLENIDTKWKNFAIWKKKDDGAEGAISTRKKNSWKW